nr:hypothetical protein [uncultured Rhodopila sp.]
MPRHTRLPEAMNDAACSALMTLERNLLQPIRTSPMDPGECLCADLYVTALQH